MNLKEARRLLETPVGLSYCGIMRMIAFGNKRNKEIALNDLKGWHEGGFSIQLLIAHRIVERANGGIV